MKVESTTQDHCLAEEKTTAITNSNRSWTSASETTKVVNARWRKVVEEGKIGIKDKKTKINRDQSLEMKNLLQITTLLAL